MLEQKGNASMEWNKMVPELTVFDFEKSLKFYTEVLGFNVKFGRPEQNFAYLDQEGVQIMLEQYHEDGWNSGTLEPPLGRGINFQMEFENIEFIYQRLKAINHPFFRESKDVWRKTGNIQTGSREFLIQDPDGYLLRFQQHLGEKGLEANVQNPKN
jgi:catechol 2,3-dioxygenase-like lactoylglutathione lyase family enzyme